MTDNTNETNPDPSKIIQIADHFKTDYTPWVQSGIDALTSLSPAEQKAAIELILNYVFMEVKVGLGLVDPIDDEEPDLSIFRRINTIYEEAAGDCYFCSDKVDPNEQDFHPGETPVCPICAIKVTKVAKAMGITATTMLQSRSAKENGEKE